MHFDLDDDQKAIRDTVATFLNDKLNSIRALELSDAGGLDREFWNGLCGLGLTSVLAPADHGGLGMELLTLAVIAEELGRAAAPAPVVSNALAAWLIGLHGSEQQRSQWLDRLFSGDAVAAFALTEDDERVTPEQWTLTEAGSGRKVFVEWGRQADLLVVGVAGGKLGLVAADAPGVQILDVDALDRTRPLAEVRFEQAQIDSLATDPALARRLLDALLVTLSADGFGAASRALNLSVEYAKERQQFGQPIGAFQAIKHQLANMAVDVEPARALYWYAAHAWDALPAEAEQAIALAKAHIGSIAVKTARMSVEVHGGIGYTWEYPLHLWLKRAMYDRTMLGGPAVHYARAAQLAQW